jgi:hypothetical protein
MNTNPLPTLRTATRGNYVLLRADTLRLLLPQDEVGAVEYLEVRPRPRAQAGLFDLPQGDGARSVAALSHHMTLMPTFPDDRFLVTSLAGAGDDIVWSWNEVKVLFDVALQPQTLPAVLRGPDMPVDEYVEADDGIAYLCSAQRLGAFALARRG